MGFQSLLFMMICCGKEKNTLCVYLSGTTPILVAVDVTARGFDIPYDAHVNCFALEGKLSNKCLCCWSRTPGASELSIRNLPPLAIGDPSNLDATSLLIANKGRVMQGIQTPSMVRRAASDEPNGEGSVAIRSTLTLSQRIAATSTYPTKLHQLCHVSSTFLSSCDSKQIMSLSPTL